VAENGLVYRARDTTRFDDKALYEMTGIPEAQVRNLAERQATLCLDRTCTFSLPSRTGPVGFLYVGSSAASHPSNLVDLCARADVVVSSDLLPGNCRPRWLRLDAGELSRQGGGILDLDHRAVRRARPDGDRHGW
jgi:competence protein ComEC